MVVGADPEGSVLSGDTARPYLTEGVGEDFFPGTLDPAIVDRWVRVSDRDAFAMARRITREEGILAGESCGTALVAALERGSRADRRREPARDAVVVVILPDSGRNYLSKLYNDEWMRAQRPARRRPGGVVPRRATPGRPPPRRAAADVVVARTTDPVGRRDRPAPAATGSARCRCPRSREGARIGEPRRLGQRDAGSWSAPTATRAIVERTVGEVMDAPLPQVRENATLDEVFALLEGGASAVLATRGERPAGVVTKLDILEYLGHHPRLGS